MKRAARGEAMAEARDSLFAVVPGTLVPLVIGGCGVTVPFFVPFGGG